MSSGCFYQANFAQKNFIQPCLVPDLTGDPGGLAHAHYYARKARNRRLLAETARIAAAASVVIPAVMPTLASVDRFAIEMDALVEAQRKDDEAAQRRQVQIDEIKRAAQAAAQLYQQQLDRDNDAAAFMLLLD